MSPFPCFVPVPETRLPGGLIVPAFEVSKYLCGKTIDDRQLPAANGIARASLDALLLPWTWITYPQAVRACATSGWSLITESQWLSIAYNLARQGDNWSGRTPGVGKLLQGLHKGSVDQPCHALLQPHAASESRWKTLPNSYRICDFGGNAWSWVHDDIQGATDGTAKTIFPDSPSLTTAPLPPRQHGMGIRPTDRRDWKGRALIRGGDWRGGKDSGAFALYAARVPFGYRSVGFRATRPITREEDSHV